MKIFQLKTTQNLSVSIDDAWDFFSDPKNLAKITPDWLNFEIQSDLSGKVHAGMIIHYKVRPILNIPISWVSEITHLHKPFYFVDEQLFGPYKLWHHEHLLSTGKNGETIIEDIVSYVVPFGIFGRLLNRFVVRKKLTKIFNYRKRVLERMFGNLKK